jgi:RNase P subunit RPR2
MTLLAEWTQRYCRRCGTLLKSSVDFETGEFVEECPGCHGLWTGREVF